MAGKSDYPAKTWAVIREIYESMPAKFSIEKIRAKAQEFLPNEKIPSREAIGWQSRQQNWTKTSHKQTKLDSKKLKNSIKELIAMTDECSEKIPNQAVATVSNMEIVIKNENLFQLTAFEKRKSAQVILEHRTRSYKAGLMLDNTVNKLQKQLDILLDFANYFENNPDEFMGMDIETAYNHAHRTYDKLLSTINAVESVSRTVGSLAKMDFVLYGLNPDDTREPDSDKRITSLMNDDEYYKQKQELLRAEGEKIAKRMAMIQSGQLEDEVRQEMITLAQQDSDVIDDAEFDEIL